MITKFHGLTENFCVDTTKSFSTKVCEVSFSKVSTSYYFSSCFFMLFSELFIIENENDLFLSFFRRTGGGERNNS